MPDPYERLPADDEAPAALLADYNDYLATAVPGWAPSDAALEEAIGAALADEGSTLYSLLREDADDRFRDFGATFVNTPAVEPAAASALTTWTARSVAGVGGWPIDAGTQIVVNSDTGTFAFEVVQDAVIPDGDIDIVGVLVRALEPGVAANLADGPVIFDEPPAWVQSVTLDAPATGGTDGDTDEEHAAKVRAAVQLLSRAPILPEDFAKVAQEIDEVGRALVRNLYDDLLALDNQERTVSIYPVQLDGTACSPAGKAEIEAKVLARREVNWVCRVADPTYTEVNLAIEVAAIEGYEHADVATRVEAAIAAGPLSPALFGQPPLGERLRWLRRTTVRAYEVASAADLVDGVDYVTEVAIVGADGDGNLPLTGSAPLPTPGTINVTVIDAS